MGKHISKEIKYDYVKRYINGESPSILGREVNPHTKSPGSTIIGWYKKYQSGGIMELESKTGKKSTGRPPKKKKLIPEEMTREELIDYVKIMEETNEIFQDFFKKKMRSRFLYPLVSIMKRKYKRSIEWLCMFYGVSKSGYYSWRKNPKCEDNYNQEWLNIIKNEFYLNKEIYGAERIWASLGVKNILKVSLNTIKRYMIHLGLKSKIRNPKNKRENKDTTKILKNYIAKNFKDDSSRSKVFTDTTEYKLETSKIYFSAVLNANETLHGLEASHRNNEELIQSNISKSIKSIGRKFYIHFDNAAFYKNKNMIELISSANGIRSYSYPGESLDNQPIEYFWSILKQEYLNPMKFKNIEEVRKAIPKIIFHYNHVRIQKNLNWNTPAKARA